MYRVLVQNAHMLIARVQFRDVLFLQKMGCIPPYRLFLLSMWLFLPTMNYFPEHFATSQCFYYQLTYSTIK